MSHPPSAVVTDADLLQAPLLVVDDHAMNVRLVELTLRREGYTTVVTTTDPFAVTALCQQVAPGTAFACSQCSAGTRGSASMSHETSGPPERPTGPAPADDRCAGAGWCATPSPCSRPDSSARCTSPNRWTRGAGVGPAPRARRWPGYGPTTAQSKASPFLPTAA